MRKVLVLFFSGIILSLGFFSCTFYANPLRDVLNVPQKEVPHYSDSFSETTELFIMCSKIEITDILKRPISKDKYRIVKSFSGVYSVELDDSIANSGCYIVVPHKNCILEITRLYDIPFKFDLFDEVGGIRRFFATIFFDSSNTNNIRFTPKKNRGGRCWRGTGYNIYGNKPLIKEGA